MKEVERSRTQMERDVRQHFGAAFVFQSNIRQSNQVLLAQPVNKMARSETLWSIDTPKTQ
jgi:hypothetical protein